MKRKRLYRFRFIWAVLILVLAQTGLYAQSNCSQTLSDAVRKFEAGQLTEIPDFVSSCLRNGFTKDERIQAYKLLTLVHLYQDDKENAEKSFLNMLLINKEFIADTKSDPSELIYLADMYRIRPIFTVQARVGTSITVPKVINRYTLGNDFKSIEKYTPSVTFKASGAIEYTFLKYLQVGTEFSFNYSSFNYSNTLNEETEVNFKESQLWTDFPLYLKAGVSFGKYTPYIYGGASYSLLISSRASNLESIYDKGGESEEKYEGPDIDIKELRTGNNISFLGGVGLKVKQRTNYLVVDFRFTKGIRNLVDGSTRYNVASKSQQLANYYYYVDPDFSINQYSLTIGYIYSIYKPKKLNKK